jgi:hypothetical protein
MVSQHLAELEEILSKPRLDAYALPGGTDLDKIVNYLWNIDLAEALVPSLHAIEVGLRNAIHNTLTKQVGTSLWFFKERLLRPVPNGRLRRRLRQGLQETRTHRRPHRLPVHVRLWAALLTNPYDEPIWKPNGYQALYEVFPGRRTPSRTDTVIS